MRVAFVYDVVYPHVKGGVEKRIWEVSKRLSSRGHDVHVYGMKYWEGPSVMKAEGVTFHGVCRPLELYNDSGRRSIRQALYFSMLLPFSLFRERFDVVDCQAAPYFQDYVCWLYCLLRGVPLVLTWHEYWGPYWGRYLGVFGWFGRSIEYLCTRLTSHAFAVSESTGKQLEKMGVRPAAIVPNGVDLAFIKSASAREPSDIIYVGRLIEDKHVNLVVEAVSLIREKYPGVRAVIVGSGPELAYLKKLSLLKGLQLSVSFIQNPEYERVIGLMKSSKVFAFPSTREGFGIAALEALACGLPVVTVDDEMNAARDLVRNELNGLVVPLQADQFADALRKILRDQKLQKSMSMAASDAAEEYDWDKIAERLEREYRKLSRRTRS